MERRGGRRGWATSLARLGASAVLLAACGADRSPAPPASPPRPPATSTTAPTRRPAQTPPVGLASRLDCAIGAQPAGPNAFGNGQYEGAAEPTLELAFERFLELDGPIVGYLPLNGWTTAERGTDWATFVHRVDGGTKAIAFLRATSDGSAADWSWAVAACDPAEFDPAVGVTGGITTWTDAAGRRVPFRQVGEGGVCAGTRTTLHVDGRVFALDARSYTADRVLGTYAADVRVPRTAKPTPYRNGDRRIWIGDREDAAYVGTTSHAARLPRLVNDDESVTDCN